VYFSTILFELDLLNDSQLPESDQQQLTDILRNCVSLNELVVVADYGHGMLNDAAIRHICESAPYLAVTSPVSAANLGYHTISRYPRCDFFAVAEHDLRLDRRNRARDVNSLLQELTKQLAAEKSVLTIGSKGCIGFSAADGFVSAPALATRIVDRQGAAEAAFAVSALAAILGLPLEQLAFATNVAGALATASMGNSRFLDELSFRRAVDSLLK
jgi:bifunctional ADP-heptose synthase (sugar kinase/adenylyltransferase)